MERERRLRREIANSNERRRMQSINQGYNSLKAMLPLPDGGEKLSKVCLVTASIPEPEVMSLYYYLYAGTSSDSDLSRMFCCFRTWVFRYLEFVTVDS